jgi:hypothetical protein
VFPVIRDLARSSPEIAGWQVTQFKPAMGFDFTTEYGGVIVSPENSWFIPLVSTKDPNALGIRVAFSHFDPANEDAFHYAAVLMLEGGLGELAFATHVQHLEVCLAPSNPEAGGYISVPSLPAYLRETGRAVGA